MSLDVSRETFVDLASDGDGPTVVRAVADLDVDVEPLGAYAALTGRTSTADGAGDSDYAFLLESAEKVASSDPDGAFAATTDDRHARYSFVGYDPDAVVTVDADDTAVEALDERLEGLVTTNGGDVLDDLRASMPDVDLRGFPDHDRQLLDGGLVGFLAYDAVYDLWLDEVGVLPSEDRQGSADEERESVGVERPDSRFPDAQFVLSTATLRFDHADDSVSLVFTPVLRDGAGADDAAGERYDELVAEAERVEEALTSADDLETGGYRREQAGAERSEGPASEQAGSNATRVGEDAGPRDEYEAAVETAKESVLSGDIYQGVISRKRELYGEMDPLGLYESLREINPSPYMYLLDFDGLSVVGASPETLVSVAGDHVTSNPIAGTCSRGTSPVEDRRLAGEMLADDKERAEHTMLVDLARNDVRRVGEPGSIQVEEFMNVLKYSHVQHIESTVTGTLADDCDAFDAVRGTFPAGTLSGAPKIRAMEIIDDLEREPRGLYGGGVGYVSWAGDADFAIVIRSATIEETGDTQRTTVQAGAGIVADSVPASEYEETEKKMGGVLDAVEAIEEGSAETEAGAAAGAGAEEVSR